MNRSFLLGFYLLCAACSAQAADPAVSQAATANTTSSTTNPFRTMTWQPICIGRALIDMPTDRPRDWSNAFDEAIVRRLEQPLTTQAFWRGGETLRDQYASQEHDFRPNRLGQYIRLDPLRAAIVIGYKGGASFWAPIMWRFVHLDDQHAYEFKSVLDSDNIPPSPELFKPFVEQYTPALSQLRALKDGEIPSGEGFCVEGALFTGDTKQNAVAALNVKVAPGAYLGLSYRENLYGSAWTTAFEDLAADQQRANAKMMFPQMPEGFKSFNVLRKQERTLAGLKGQEVVTRTSLNNGHVYYRMNWIVKGAVSSLTQPDVSIYLSTPDEMTDVNGQAYAPLPPENELMGLWDKVLASFRLRPGALPAGQTVRTAD